MDVLELMFFLALVPPLAVAARSDLRTRTVPNGCSVAVAVLGLARAVARGALPEALLGAAAVAAVLLATAKVFLWLRGDPGIGGGDVKLLAASAVWTGPFGGLAAVAFACAFGLAASGAYRLYKCLSGRKIVIPTLISVSGGIPMAPAIGISVMTILLLEAFCNINLEIMN